MSKTEQQRQKKLAKKRTKDVQKRKELAHRNQVMASISGKMEWASRFPVHACYVSEEGAGSAGMRTVHLARKVGMGQLAFAFILLDTHCLGVKDAGARICTVSKFEEFLEGAAANQEFLAREPSYAKKLVDQSIAYAASLGLSPHPDYRKIAPIWGDIAGDRCTETFEFGFNGKPSYFAGPFDDAAKQRLIYASLCETVGEGNFHFTLLDGSNHFIRDKR